MNRLFLPALVCATFLVGPRAESAAAWTAVISSTGEIRLEHDGRTLGTLEPGLHEVPWRGALLIPAKPGANAKDDVYRGRIQAPGGAEVETELRVAEMNGGAKWRYQLTPRQSVQLNSLHVALTLPASEWARGSYVTDGEEGELPALWKSVVLRAGPTRSLKLVSAAGKSLRIAFAEPTHVLVQDDRQWNQTFSVRIGPALNENVAWPANKTLAVNFELSVEGGLALERDEPVTITAGPDWVPLEVELDIVAGSALDFSKVIPQEAPAGKFGRVIATPQGKFAFAQRPEAPVRFYGVNLCFSGQYLAHDEADRLAERLARLGYNALRIHHYEGELVDRSEREGLRLHPEKLDQLDYLFAALKRRGIYVTTDLFVSRPVPAGEVYPGEAGEMEMDDFKMAVVVNDRAFANYQKFAEALLGHVNPYTKIRYADDPALAWLSLVNEGNPGNFIGKLKGPLREDWQRAWNRWLARRFADRGALLDSFGPLPEGVDPAKNKVPLPAANASSHAATLFSVFLAEMERDFFVRIRKFLREQLRCEALLTDLNGWTNPVQMQAVRREFDYVDDHFYVDHPHFLDKPWSLPSRCSNTSPIADGAPGGRICAFTRLFGKPFTITEFNYAAPGRFRGVGGILTGALGALQDWDGLWRFAYSHEREAISQPARMGYFDIVSDPLNQAAERASLCLFLRGDLPIAKPAVAIASTPAQLLEKPTSSRDNAPPWNELAWLARVGWSLDDGDAAQPDTLRLAWPGGTPDAFAPEIGGKLVETFRERGWLPPGNHTDLGEQRFQSGNGGITIDAPANILTIDTARTAGGFAPAGKRIETRAASIHILDTDATVWVSSLDENPIATSRRLLITHLTDLQNTQARYARYAGGDQRVLLDWGTLPHLVRTGRAEISLRLAHPDRARIYALATSGRRMEEIAAEPAKPGALTISLNTAAAGKARMLYEVEIAP